MPMHLKDAFRGMPNPQAEPRQDRRQFLQTLAVGGNVACLTWLLPVAGTRAAGQAEALLLSCMDFRLVNATVRYMASRGLTDQYDHIILAGGALGALTEKFPAWNQTFWEHLGVAIDLHKIHRVMVMDHRDCGAYKVILGEDFAKAPLKEAAIHASQLQRLGKKVKEQYPALEVELLLMALDGQVEVMS